MVDNEMQVLTVDESIVRCDVHPGDHDAQHVSASVVGRLGQKRLNRSKELTGTPSPKSPNFNFQILKPSIEGDACDAGDVQKNFSVLHLWALTSTQLAFGFVMADQGMFLAPVEVERLFPGAASVGLGGVGLAVGVGQLVGPASGYWSDHYISSMGRRRPCMLICACFMVLFTACQCLASQNQAAFSFLSFFILQQASWNALLSVHAGLVADVVPKEQAGVAGGAVGANILVGANMALLSVRLGGGVGSVLAHYGAGVGLGLLSVLLVCTVGKEKPSHKRAAMLASEITVDGMEQQNWFWSVYGLRVNQSPQFAKLLLAKTFYMCSLTVKPFFLFLIEDTMRVSKASSEVFLGDCAFIGELCAAVSAIGGTFLLGSVGRQSESDTEAAGKRESLQAAKVSSFARLFAVSSSVLMGLTWLGPMCIIFAVARERETTRETNQNLLNESLLAKWYVTVLVLIGVWGFGQGAYITGDQALNYGLLPDRDAASRLLGLSSICSFVGFVSGGMLMGSALHVFNRSSSAESRAGIGPGYSCEAYAAMLMLATILGIVVAYIMKTIKL